MQSVLILVFSAFFLVHPFYVSVTEINHNKEASTLECTIKTFTSDIEETLDEQGFGKLLIGTMEENPTADSIINNYLMEVFQFTVNDLAVSFSYLGKEVEEDVTWFYLELENIDDIKSIEITNQLLFEFQEAQKNLLHFYSEEEERSLLFTYSKSSSRIEF